MPDIVQHHAFGTEVRETLAPEIREYLAEQPYIFALYGPDPWFMYRPVKPRQGRGRRMHTTRTGEFLRALALQAKTGTAPRETFSYLAGFLCHYALDSHAHPYIIWRTTQTWPTKGAHRDMEHALDAARLKREGRWGEKHPVTDYHLPKIRLPRAMAEDLDAVYGRIYGWKNLRRALNGCYRRLRMVYRVMENPRGIAVRVNKAKHSPSLRSYSYASSDFLERDVENLAHDVWQAPFNPEQSSTESFPELYEKAKAEAVRMITDCWRFAREGTLSEEELRASLGNRSYLSGLDWDDPRNYSVPSLRPPEPEDGDPA